VLVLEGWGDSEDWLATLDSCVNDLNFLSFTSVQASRGDDDPLTGRPVEVSILWKKCYYRITWIHSGIQ
jgi:hypothetical protein